MPRPREFRACLLDVEGVLVRDKRYVAVPGAVEWVAGLGARGWNRVLVSNNTTHPPAHLARALTEAGFDLRESEIVSALQVGADLLKGWGKTRILWLGTPDLCDWWRDGGFELVEDGDCEAVVLGVNRDLTVADLDRALPALIDAEAELVALHRNLFWLDEHGRRRFGPGFYSAALERAAPRDTVIVGKPHERIYREALNRAGVTAADALFISDDPEADLVTAKRLGMGTAFVLSGKYEDHGVLARMEQDDWPDTIAASLADLEI